MKFIVIDFYYGIPTVALLLALENITELIAYTSVFFIFLCKFLKDPTPAERPEAEFLSVDDIGFAYESLLHEVSGQFVEFTVERFLLALVEG